MDQHGIGGFELAANVFNALSIWLAARNSVHTWWTGIVGCALFAWVFTAARLYADTTLQVFFIASCVAGWVRWQRGEGGAVLPIRRTRPRAFVALAAAAAAVALGYGWLLHRFTDAYAPFLDSVVLAGSVIGQLLLIQRRYESWWFWLLVNSVAVPLYASRELYLTAVLYAAFWVNAVVALLRWRRLVTVTTIP